MWKSFSRSPVNGILAALGTAIVFAALLLVATRNIVPASEPELTLPGSDEVTALAFSPDGRTLAVGDVRGRVRLWDPATGQELPSAIKHLDAIWSLAFSPDGTLLASGSRDATVRLSDAASGELVGNLNFGGWVQCIVFFPDGLTLAASTSEGSVELWDLATRVLRTSFREPTCPLAASIAFAPDRTTLACASVDGPVRLRDAATGAERRTLSGHAQSAFCVAYAPNGELLASASADGTVRFWRERPGRRSPRSPGTKAR